MSEIQLAHFSFGGETLDRSRIHEVALREARIASEHRGEPAATEREGILSRLGLTRRLRLSLAGGPATEACSCPA
jgi:hypothetical protein